MIKFLIEKEFKQIVRNPFMVRIIFLMPMLMLVIMPWAADQEIKDLKLSVVDNDHSTYSKRLVNKTTASNYFKLTAPVISNEEALNTVDAGKADAILEIPQDFEKDLIMTGNGKVMITVNAVNGVKGGLGTSYLSAIVNDFAKEIMKENGNAPLKIALQNVPIKPRFRYNPNLDYKVFMLPALMVMLLTIICGFLPALNIVNEKEVGTIEQLNVTPVKKSLFILAKLIPYWLIGYIVLTIGFVLSALIYGVYPVGSTLTLYLYATIYILVMSGMGLVVSNYSSTMQQAQFVSVFFIMILILISGLFFPINSMPRAAQLLTYINPLRFFMEVMRAIYLKGSGITDLLPQLGILIAFAVVLNSWAIISYRKSQ